MLGNNFERSAPPLSENIPSFHFTAEEIRKMKEGGMTEDDIEKKMNEVVNKLAREQSIKH